MSCAANGAPQGVYPGWTVDHPNDITALGRATRFTGGQGIWLCAETAKRPEFNLLRAQTIDEPIVPTALLSNCNNRRPVRPLCIPARDSLPPRI
ncbi:MAG: hypothetical protein AAF745_17350, partial [Planctomycetota bacterium]